MRYLIPPTQLYFTFRTCIFLHLVRLKHLQFHMTVNSPVLGPTCCCALIHSLAYPILEQRGCIMHALLSSVRPTGPFVCQIWPSSFTTESSMSYELQHYYKPALCTFDFYNYLLFVPNIPRLYAWANYFFRGFSEELTIAIAPMILGYAPTVMTIVTSTGTLLHV